MGSSGLVKVVAATGAATGGATVGSADFWQLNRPGSSEQISTKRGKADIRVGMEGMLSA
ncbi:MAG: hypothetical protein NVS3B25_20860 [Hymenobacter sp.]